MFTPRIASATLVLLVAGTAFAPPSLGATGSQIAFRRDDGHGGQIIVTDGEGHGARRVDTDGMAAHRAPAWSPDRQTLAYSASALTGAGTAVFTVNVAGGQPKRVAAGTAPAWSPSGDALAVTTEDGGIATVDLVHGAVDVLEDGSGGYRSHYCPAWSPDGTRVAAAVASYGTGGHAGPDGSQLNEIVVLARAGTVMGRFDLGPDSSCPTWSPDGTQLAVSVVDRSRRIVVIDADGHVVRRFDPPACAEDAWPSWSPAGLAFDRSFASKSSLEVLPTGCADPAASGMWLVRDAGQPVQVVHTSDRLLQLSWSSDLRTIVGTAQRLVGSRYTTHVVLVGLDGTLRHLLVPDGVDDGSAVATSWTPVPAVRSQPAAATQRTSATTSPHTTATSAAGPPSTAQPTARPVGAAGDASVAGEKAEAAAPDAKVTGSGSNPSAVVFGVGAALLAAVAVGLALRRRRATTAGAR